MSEIYLVLLSLLASGAWSASYYDEVNDSYRQSNSRIIAQAVTVVLSILIFFAVILAVKAVINTVQRHKKSRSVDTSSCESMEILNPIQEEPRADPEIDARLPPPPYSPPILRNLEPVPDLPPRVDLDLELGLRTSPLSSSSSSSGTLSRHSSTSSQDTALVFDGNGRRQVQKPRKAKLRRGRGRR